MLKQIFAALVCILTFTTQAIAQDGIQFTTKNWNEVLELAKKENKPIFLDCYTTWCGPCKMLKEKVFPQKEVGEFFNKNYINVAMDMDTEAGKALATVYTIKGYPTLFFLTPGGDILLQKLGAPNADQLLSLGKEALTVTNPTKVNQKTTKKLTAGELLPNATYKNQNEESVSLESLKGKYLYIDFWATWCGPCCAEIPHLKKLEEKFHGKNIEFVSISCDKDLTKWKDMVQKEQLGGIQLNVRDDRALMDAFGIRGIPYFVLVDPQGKIVNVGMTRPSDPATTKVFETLLQ
ncbi:MAG: TlpA family protein disulfide reductase [Marinifilaceae bacterium]